MSMMALWIWDIKPRGVVTHSQRDYGPSKFEAFEALKCDEMGVRKG